MTTNTITYTIGNITGHATLYNYNAGDYIPPTRYQGSQILTEKEILKIQKLQAKFFKLITPKNVK
jgi:hypothetical protein